MRVLPQGIGATSPGNGLPLRPLQILSLDGTCWGEELWQGVGPPLGEFTCKQCSNRPKDDKLLHPNPNFVCGYTAQVPAVLGTVLGKSVGANGT